MIRSGRIAHAVFALAGLCLAFHATAESPSEPTWRLTAKANRIVVGTLHVPHDEIAKAAQGQEPYAAVSIPVTVSDTLKGSRHDEELSFYFRPNVTGWWPSLDQLNALEGQTVLVYLAGQNLATPSPESLQPATAAAIQAAKAEVAEQERLIARFKAMPSPPPRTPHYYKVKKLIRRMKKPETADRAAVELERLGVDAVPAIILQLDDASEIIQQPVMVPTSGPFAFEALAHYKVDTVYGALKMVLQHATGESFAGGQEDVCNAWGVYYAHFPELRDGLKAKEAKGGGMPLFENPEAFKHE